MYVVSRQTAKLIDEYTINTIGIPSIVLMENAGEKIFELIKSGVFVESFNRNKRKLQEFFMDIISGGNIHD